MKKSIVLIAFTTFVFAGANAQLIKNNLFIGGSVGFNSSSESIKVGSTSSDQMKTTSVFIEPTVGYFIMDRTAIGIMASFTTTKEVDYTFGGLGDKRTTTTTPVSIGLFGRRYFMVTDVFGFTGTVVVSALAGNRKVEDYDQSDNETTIREYQTSGLDAGLRGGIFWFASPHVGLEANVGILSFRTETETQKNSNPEFSSTESGVNFGIDSYGLSLGLHYYFF